MLARVLATLSKRCTSCTLIVALGRREMTDHDPFVIDAVEWHLGAPGNPETLPQILDRFRVLAEFLDSNGLSAAPLLPEGRLPDRAFAVRSSDLTPEGLAVMRAGYDRWLKALDRGTSPSDSRILQRALAKVRGAP